jgi:hypothetical protein
MLRIAACAVLALLATPALGATVLIEADRDATLIESVDGSLANGSGAFLTVGRTNQSQDALRRALVRFDVASALPRRARIESVALTLCLTSGNAGAWPMELRRVQSSWTEGPTAVGGGSGAPSAPGDVTWIHTSYPDELWPAPGGHFIGRVSASQVVDGPGCYVWASAVRLSPRDDDSDSGAGARRAGQGLVQDVRLWLANPRRNHGWIVIGDEATRQSAQSFASSENASASLRPVLAVTYR